MRGLATHLIVLEPLLVVLVAMGAVAAVRRREIWALAPVAIVGGALAFQVLAFVRGETYGFLRYYIAIVPLAVLLAGALIPRRAREAAPARGWRRVLAGGIALASVASVAAALPASAIAMRDAEIAPQEAPLASLARTDLSVAERRQLTEPFTVERAVARYMDRLRLPDGAVLLDVAFGFPIVLESRRPQQFVIPPDRDFAAAVAAPKLFDVRYLLVVPNDGLGRIDALNRAYPRVFEDGAGVGRLVQEFRGRGQPWRLYEVTSD